MKTTTTRATAQKTAPFAPGALILRKGWGGPALRFSHMDENGTVYAKGASYDEQDPETLHDCGADLSRLVVIPEVVTMPSGAKLSTQSRAALAELVKRADRHFKASAQAWEDRNNDSKLPRAEFARLEAREQSEAERGAELLAPLGIACDWPGLYPSFKVHGYGEHSTESAVLAAVGLPRNALRGHLGAMR